MLFTTKRTHALQHQLHYEYCGNKPDKYKINENYALLLTFKGLIALPLMEHFQLIILGQILGFNLYRGVWKGFINMWIQAVCCGELKQFSRRLTSL